MTISEKPIPLRRHNLLAALLLAALVALPACESVDSRPPLFASVDLPVTLVEVRLRLSDFNEYFAAVVEDATETVIDTSDDQVVRRNAMEFRLRSVNVFMNALNKPDPVAAVIDAWAFCMQLVEFLAPGGAGEELFGEHQALVLDATRSIATEVDQLVVEVTRDPAPPARSLVVGWVDENPLASLKMIRSSTTILIADQIESQEGSAFSALGRLQAGVEDIVAQYQRYISIMPRTIRWQSQLILHETLYDEFDLGNARVKFDVLLEDFETVSDTMHAAFSMLPDRETLDAEIAAAMAMIDSIVEEERARLVAEIDRQRGLVFDDIAAQREAIMHDIEVQLEVAEERIQEQLDLVFVRIETLTQDTLDRSIAEGEHLINMLFLRVLTLLLIALAGGAGLVLLHKWRHPITVAGRQPRSGAGDPG